jgi:hypothetical protein
VLQQQPADDRAERGTRRETGGPDRDSKPALAAVAVAVAVAVRRYS